MGERSSGQGAARAALLALLVSGCSAAHKAASLGDQALERNDLDGAALHYRDACQLEPADAFYCSRAKALFERLEREVLAQAKPACAARNTLACLAAVERARAIATNPELDALATQAGGQWLEQCAQLPLDSPLRALYRLRCVEAVRARVRTRPFEEQASAARLEISRFVRSAAAQAQGGGLRAAGLALSALARCFAREGNIEQELEQAYLGFLGKTAISVAVGGDGLLDTARLCDALPGLTRGRVVCGVKGRPTELALRLALQRGPLDEQVSDTYRDVEYVASREEYANPEWQRLESRAFTLEQQERTARLNASVAKEGCEAARRALSAARFCNNCSERTAQTNSCATSDTYDAAFRRARADLDSAQSLLRRTDKVLVREVRDTFRYTERQHLWRQPYRVYFAASGSEQLETRDDTAALTATDTEHPGFAPAGLQAKLLTVPQVADFDEQMRAKALSDLASWLEPELKGRAEARRATCPGDALQTSAGLDCALTAAFLEGRDPAKELVAILGQRLEADPSLARYPKSGCVE